MSASGIFTHSKAEILLQQLIDTTKRHEKEISSLHKLYNIDFSADDGEGGEGRVILGKLKSIEERMNVIEEKMNAIEKSVQVPGGTSSLTVGEGVAANRKTLVRTLGILATKADAEEVKADALSCKKELDVALEELKSSLADNETVEKTNDALAAISNRIDVLSNDVQNKVDNASFKVISSDANMIRNHASFVKRTDEAMKKLEHDLASQNEKIGEQDETAKGITNTISCLQKETKNEFHSLAQKVTSLVSIAEGKANKDEFKKLKEANGKFSDKTASIEKELRALISAHERLGNHLGRRINDVAASSEKQIEECVRNDQLHSILCDLRAELAAKAWVQSVEDLERLLLELKMDFGVTKKKAELAAQFVAWYGNRGDTYEHNLQAVDAHLKNLATNGRAHR